MLSFKQFLNLYEELNSRQKSRGYDDDVHAGIKFNRETPRVFNV